MCQELISCYDLQVGKALFDGQLLDVHFTRSFYKHILGVKVTYHDIEAIDPDYFKNLKWMLEVGLLPLFIYFIYFYISFLLLCMWIGDSDFSFVFAE